MTLTIGIPLVAVILGALITEFGAKKVSKFKQLLLGFSGSFLLSITLIGPIDVNGTPIWPVRSVYF